MKKGFAFFCGLIAGSMAGGVLVKKLWLEKYRGQNDALSAAVYERELLYSLLKLNQNGVRLSEYFTSRGLCHVAVLGMGREGRYLLDELGREGEITPAYGVEADCLGSVHETLIVYRLGEDELPPADCLAVCDLNRTDKKVDAAHREFKGTVVTLDEIVSWLMDKHGIRKWRGRLTSNRPVR